MSNTVVREVEPVNLVAEAMQIQQEEYRLVQICATRNEQGFELLYTFGKEYDVLNLRIFLLEDAELLSISHIFAPAFLYENEIHDLFGIPIKLMSIDYQGHMYRMEKQTPFR